MSSTPSSSSSDAGPSRPPPNSSSNPPSGQSSSSPYPPFSAHSSMQPPSVGKPPHQLFPPLHSPSSHPTTPPAPPPMPEKCLTFCSQRSDAPPLCRMFCLRRKELGLSRSEQLARLRPPPTVRHTQAQASPSPLAASSPSWSPFEAMRRRLEPYSFVYIRGTPDGVVGRYMEELEYDDGQHDFGGISRGHGMGEGERRRIRGEDKVERLDWGDHGYVFYLPMTSLFSPFINLPANLSRVFSPALNFLTAYHRSFSDGTQSRALDMLKSDIEKGGAAAMARKLDGHLHKLWKQANDELEAERKERDQAVRERLQEQQQQLQQAAKKDGAVGQAQGQGQGQEELEKVRKAMKGNFGKGD